VTQPESTLGLSIVLLWTDRVILEEMIARIEGLLKEPWPH